MSWSDRRQQQFVLLRNAAPFVSAVVVALFGLVTYASARRADEATREVARTHAVIDETQETLTRLVDAETGQRGFVITGDSVYLEPFRGAAAEVRARLQTLR